MTEDEAKTKPCISHAAFNVGRAVEGPDRSIVYLCSGSACLAWREYDAQGGTFIKKVYCGLAGKP